MTQMLIAGLCGFLGGATAFIVALATFVGRRSDAITITRGRRHEFSKKLEVLENAARPQGLYVRFRNAGTKPIESAHFRVRGYKEQKLWVEIEESAYVETAPGQEQEAILKLVDFRGGSAPIDLSGCRVAVTPLYGLVQLSKTKE